MTRLKKILLFLAMLGFGLMVVGLFLFALALVCGIVGFSWAQGSAPPTTAMFGLATMVASVFVVIIPMSILIAVELSEGFKIQ